MREGLDFGALIGLFLGSYGVLGEAAKFPVEPVSTWILVESAFFFLQFRCIGAALGIIPQGWIADGLRPGTCLAHPRDTEGEN